MVVAKPVLWKCMNAYLDAPTSFITSEFITTLLFPSPVASGDMFDFLETMPS